MSDRPARPTIKNAALAPFIHFDAAPTMGVSNNIVVLDLSAIVRNVYPDNKVSAEQVYVAHLSCSLEAALNLRNAIDQAFKMANFVPPASGDEDEEPSPGEALRRRERQLQS